MVFGEVGDVPDGCRCLTWKNPGPVTLCRCWFTIGVSLVVTCRVTLCLVAVNHCYCVRGRLESSSVGWFKFGCRNTLLAAPLNHSRDKSLTTSAVRTEAESGQLSETELEFTNSGAWGLLASIHWQSGCRVGGSRCGGGVGA